MPMNQTKKTIKIKRKKDVLPPYSETDPAAVCPPKGCKECGGALVDEDDLLCHKCYHQSVPEGECWCNNVPPPPKCECESDTESEPDYSNIPPTPPLTTAERGSAEWIEAVGGVEEIQKVVEAHTEAVCPPVNKKAQRTFVNLGIDPKTAERFKPDDTCERCGHFFKRGMIKEYHYASKNCQKQKPYSETEKGQAGKGGEHTARKARKAADPTRELTKEITAFRKTNQLRGFFNYKDNVDKRKARDTLYDNLVDIPKFLGWIINNIEEAKEITSMEWGQETADLLGKIFKIELEIQKQKTTVSLGGVELGSKGGGEEFITVGTFMDWEY